MKSKYLRLDRHTIGWTFLWFFLTMIFVFPESSKYFGGTFASWVVMPPFTIYPYIAKIFGDIIKMPYVVQETIRTILFLSAFVLEFLYVDFFVSLYVNKQQKNLPLNVGVSDGVNSIPKTDQIISIKPNYSKILWWLVGLQYSILILYILIFIFNGFSVDGEAFGTLIWIYGITLFVPTAIAFIILFFKYFIGSLKNWKQSENIQRANFVLFLIQLIIYFYVLTFLP